MYKKYVKRIIDIIIGLCALPFVIIVVLFCGTIIYFSDKGPIFYNSIRLGKDGKPYKMFKLRSMKVNAPDIRNTDGSTFNGDDDPRVTNIGHFMRKTSLDEFPQFLNVLLGNMSIIGPRPTVPIEGLNFQELSDIEKKHYMVKPGITGYSQAYFRNSINQDEKFVNDAYYADNISFFLDIKVFLKTIQSVVGRKNIYNK
ncbi:MULTISPECIES: sugar transferase [Coprobacillaceae]|uniref:sugar transferase n=1 Tax=Coprobacillaceae TaxID=2810280 RepID=UPI000E53670E|nr:MULTISPECIES: sugar transferase [Coprobacillaceae]RHM62814.1 sugar transferase [Coprobacillus sp. AF33-1AC]RHS96111.1 sugar transferase [Erysipelatoclostridium sp. AM42-17]